MCRKPLDKHQLLSIRTFSTPQDALDPQRLMYGAHACRCILGVAHLCAGILNGGCSLLSSTWYPDCFGNMNLFL